MNFPRQSKFLSVIPLFSRNRSIFFFAFVSSLGVTTVIDIEGVIDYSKFASSIVNHQVNYSIMVPRGWEALKMLK